MAERGPKLELRPGDVILFAGKSFSARLTNWFQAWFTRDGTSRYNHAAVVVSSAGEILESVRWWPRVVSLKRRYRRSWVMIVRWRGMTPERCRAGLDQVAYLKGRLYPVWRQLLHAVRLAWLVTGADAVCSELVAKFLSGAGARQENWAGINVADLHQEFLNQPLHYQVVFEGRLQDFW